MKSEPKVCPESNKHMEDLNGMKDTMSLPAWAMASPYNNFVSTLINNQVNCQKYSVSGTQIRQMNYLALWTYSQMKSRRSKSFAKNQFKYTKINIS